MVTRGNSDCPVVPTTANSKPYGHLTCSLRAPLQNSYWPIVPTSANNRPYGQLTDSLWKAYGQLTGNLQAPL